MTNDAMLASNPYARNNDADPNPPSTRRESDGASRPRLATPPRGDGAGGSDRTNDDAMDDNDSDARAAAETSVLAPAGPGTGVGGEAGGELRGGASGVGRGRAVQPGAEDARAAIQGTDAGDVGAEAQAFEVVDEGGELVRVRFHEFLQHL